MTAPPDHVRAAFGVSNDIPQLMSGGRGQTYRCGGVVLKPTADPAQASWLAGTFEHLWIPGVRVARPVRSSDGRWVIAGWTAHRYVAGRSAPRFGDVIGVGAALHTALAGIPRPRLLDEADTLFSWADRISWGDIPPLDPKLGTGAGAGVFAGLAAGRLPVDLPAQLVHGDLTGNVLFAGSAPPAVIDMTPYWRPVSWATAVVVVDAISWGGADPDLATGRQTPQWRQVLRRALLFRLAVALGHPGSTPASMVGVLSAAERLQPLLDDELPGLADHAPDLLH